MNRTLAWKVDASTRQLPQITCEQATRTICDVKDIAMGGVSMRAAVFTTEGPTRGLLEVVEVPDPQPSRGEVRVRVFVSGVNPTDWKARARQFPWEQQIPNQDGAGEIDAVGEGVDPSRIGERVWIFHAAADRPNGTAAEYACVPMEQAVPLPDAITFSQGAGLGIPYITAHRCLFADGPLDDCTVLVAGGGGAVGHAAIELGRWGGANIVTTVSSEEKMRIALSAGADAVLNYRDDDFAEQLLGAAPEGVDRVIEVALGTNLDASLKVLRNHGVVVTYARDENDPAIPVWNLMTKNVTLRFVLVYNLTRPMIEHAVQDITQALLAGAVRPLPEHRFKLDEIAAAHDAVEQGAVGKVLVDIQ